MKRSKLHRPSPTLDAILSDNERKDIRTDTVFWGKFFIKKTRPVVQRWERERPAKNPNGINKFLGVI